MYRRLKLIPVTDLVSIAAALVMMTISPAKAGMRETILPGANSEHSARPLPKYNFDIDLDHAAQRKSAHEREEDRGFDGSLDRQRKIEPLFVLRF